VESWSQDQGGDGVWFDVDSKRHVVVSLDELHTHLIDIFFGAANSYMKEQNRVTRYCQIARQISELVKNTIDQARKGHMVEDIVQVCLSSRHRWFIDSTRLNTIELIILRISSRED
jgi:hypothetical protein